MQLRILFFSVNAWAHEHLGSDGFSIFAISGWALSGDASKTILLWAGVALFIAAIGKSGQFPLHTWLPDAMAGPTPVSALLHSSTMVVAGVYLVARLYPVFFEGFKIGQTNVNLIAVIGGITIIIAAVLAFVQVDIKRVLAYSTVSQLGYMMMGLGVGAWLPAVFHIFTHAFFKACLFLGAGSVSHSASHHSFDMKKDMGGLWRKMPITFATFVIAHVGAGRPPAAGRLLVEGRDHRQRGCQRLPRLPDHRTGRRLPHRGVHDPVRVPHLPRQAPRRLGRARGPRRRGARDRRRPGAGRCRCGRRHRDGPRADRHPGGGAIAEGLPPEGPLGHVVPSDAHTDHGEHTGPHESNWLITVPLIILAVGALVAGFLQAPAFKIEKFKDWVEPAGVTVLYDQGRAVQAGQEPA